MLIYEVSIKIAVHFADEYLVWLKSHVQQMLQFDGFLSAKILVNKYPDASCHECAIVVQYDIESEVKLDYYFNNHAEVMRSSMPEKYKNHLQINRNILSAEYILSPKKIRRSSSVT